MATNAKTQELFNVLKDDDDDFSEDEQFYEVKRIIATGVDINASDQHGKTALSLAATLGKHTILKLLLEQPGIDVNKQDKTGKTPLHMGVQFNDTIIINSLLHQKGIDVNVQNILGETPLFMAARTGKLKCVEALLKAPSGIDVNRKDSSGMSPLKIAAEKGHTNIVNLLKKVPGIIMGDEKVDLRWIEEKLYNALNDSSRSEFNDIIKTYGEIYPFTPIAELAATYPATFQPMMSQRGTSCSVDTIFTILFESEFLRPLFYTPDWEKISPSSFSKEDCCISLPPSIRHFSEITTDIRDEYIKSLSAAKGRYERMIEKGNYSKLNTGSRNRRTLSVENTTWETMLTSLKTCSAKDQPILNGNDIFNFFEFLLTANVLRLPTLLSKNPFKVNWHYQAKPAHPLTNLSNIIAFVVLMIRPKTTVGHYIGFYRNGDTWFLVDDEVGYIHQIMDTEWFNKIFLPRLMYTLSSKRDKLSLVKDFDKKVYRIYDPDAYKPLFLKQQFLTFGERFYPHVDPTQPDTNPLNLYVAYEGIFITKKDLTSVVPRGGATGGGSVAATGGGSAAASTTRKGRRSVRKSQTRRCRRRTAN